jgi:hypothetical protein
MPLPPCDAGVPWPLTKTAATRGLGVWTTPAREVTVIGLANESHRPSTSVAFNHGTLRAATDCFPVMLYFRVFNCHLGAPREFRPSKYRNGWNAMPTVCVLIVRPSRFSR